MRLSEMYGAGRVKAYLEGKCDVLIDFISEVVKLIKAIKWTEKKAHSTSSEFTGRYEVTRKQCHRQK